MSNEAPTDALRLVEKAIMDQPGVKQANSYGEISVRQIANAVLRVMGAAPASPLPGGGWQDISTAPKDGTPLLAGSIHHSDREVVCWQDGLPSGSMVGLTESDAPEEGWVNDGPQKDRFYANPRYFTHWMPLPAAPTGDARNGMGEGK